MKLYIASDYTYGRYLDLPDETLSALDVAYKFGRAENGEIIHIWCDGNIDREPDARVYWDSRRRKYRCY